MPLLDLSLVTQAMLTLLDRAVTNSDAWNAANVLSVSPLSPDRLTGSHTLGFYLYHVAEDPAYKNLPPVTDASDPDIYQPMGLRLSYVLTAHSDLEGDNAARAEQLMFGLGIKALRDFTLLREDTLVAGAGVFPASLAGRNNAFRITMRTLAADEAVHYWMAGSQPLRLSAYYELSPVLLEPERLNTRTGRVFRYGVQVFTRGKPRIDGSQSTITFLAPGEVSPRTVDARPAEAAVGEQFVLNGTNLAADGTELLVHHPSWENPEVVGTDWGVSANTSTIFATVGAFAGTQPVLPGIYSVAARVTTRRTQPDGTIRDFVSASNQTIIGIVPRIDPPVAEAGGLVTVTGGNFDPGVLAGDQVQVFAGAVRLRRVAGAPAAGEFQVVDGSTLAFRFPGSFASGETAMLRILIRDAESAPFWVTVP